MTNPLVANQRANLSVSGGGKVARYYIAATFSKDNGNLKNTSMPVIRIISI